MSLKLLKPAQFHGSTRLVDSNHRFFWIITQLLLFCCAVAVVWETITRYFSNPTYIVQLTSFQEWITFPTVAICPEVNFSQQKVDEFLIKIKYPPGINSTYIGSILRQLAAFYSGDVPYEVENLQNIQLLLEYNEIDVETAGTMLTATCEETLIKCFWRGENIDCWSLFQMEMTSYGFCCVFNGRSLKREMKKSGCDKKKPVQKLHISQVGRHNGLIMAISQNVTPPSVNTDLFYKWISIKNNGNFYVDTISNGTPVPPGMELWAGYSTKGIHISDEVRDLSHTLRRCRMTNEPLKYFPEYQRKYPPGINSTYIGSILRQLAAFYSGDVPYEVENLQNIQLLLEYNEIDVETAGTMLTATCEETLIKCFWRGENIDCWSLFQMEMTSYGFCCVFNGRSLKREMKKSGCDKKKPVQKLHISQVGRHNGLIMAISQNVTPPSVNTDLFYKWISIKNNGNFYVDTISNGTPVPPGMELWAGYSTKGIHISDEVRDLSHTLRRCRMTNEPLKYFPEYQRTYCIMECQMKRVKEQCNCSQIQHPQLPGVPQCGARDLKCARSSAMSFGIGVCDCPMTCDDDVQITTPFNFDLNPNVSSFDTFYENLDLNRVSIVRLYLQHYNKMVYSRQSYFTTFNLFAQLGGVFNVFFGCSVLTLLELLMLMWRAANGKEYKPLLRKEATLPASR